ncbi:hypothetical protein BYT27DRAFT_7217919 [Phlegmacium glaucopus]|nr:hypothetical protein BYT27DRAFT_7217919 [Phlegmacium glaucopus]
MSETNPTTRVICTVRRRWFSRFNGLTPRAKVAKGIYHYWFQDRSTRIWEYILNMCPPLETKNQSELAIGEDDNELRNGMVAWLHTIGSVYTLGIIHGSIIVIEMYVSIRSFYWCWSRRVCRMINDALYLVIHYEISWYHGIVPRDKDITGRL